MTNPKSDKRLSNKKVISWGIGLLPLICCGAIFLLWYLPLDPKLPPSTELGDEPEFDALFESSKWFFLFAENNKIIETDIYGKNDRVVADIVEATQNPRSELLNRFSVSPDGKFLAVNYFNEIDTNGIWDKRLGKVLIVDTKSGKVIKIPTVLDGYEFQRVRPAYWLSPTVFLVSMHRFLGTDSASEDEVFLRYDLEDLTNSRVIEIDHCGTWKVIKDQVLLLTSRCISYNESVVWALDPNGKRVAYSEEKEFYEQCAQVLWWEDSCQQNLVTQSAASIKVESVTGGMEPLDNGLSRWYDNNSDRNYLYLNDKIVRVSDAWIEADPFRDSDIKMFIWDEVHKTFQMDIKGHYRFWHDGDYVGKVPAQQ